MPRRWENKEVDSHGAGITDDVTNAPPIFQAESNNIVFDFKTHNLSNRRGSKILRDANGDIDATLVAALLGFRIEQIFQLEDKLLIAAWNDVTFSGKIITYDEKTRAVELVRTPSSRKGLDAYSTTPAVGSFEVRLETELGKGIEGDLVSTGLDAENTNHIDHIVFNIFESDTDSVVVTNYEDRINVCYVAIGYITLDSDGAITAIWDDVVTALNGAGHTFTLISGTLTTDLVVLDGDMTVSNKFTNAKWGDENPNEVDADYRSSVTSLGHLQSPIYTGEAFVATEPYDKSFAVNPLDVNMLDPENIKPLTDRVTIKRISQYWDGSAATPEIRDAQLPATYLGQKENTVIGARQGVTGAVAEYYSIFTGLIGGAVGTTDRIWVDGDGTTTCSLKFITNLGADPTIANNMKAEIDAETEERLRGIVGIVDKAGVEWILKGTYITFAAIVSLETGYVMLEIKVLFGGVMYEITRDGIAATPQQFVNNFGTYSLGDDAIYTANNPNNLIKTQANLSVPAEYKYIRTPYHMPLKGDEDATAPIDIWIDRVVGHTDGSPETGNMPIVFANVYARKFYLEFDLAGGGTYDASNYIVFVGAIFGNYPGLNIWQDGNEILGATVGVSVTTDTGGNYLIGANIDDAFEWSVRADEPFYQVFQPNLSGDVLTINVQLKKVGSPTGTLNVTVKELENGGTPGVGSTLTGGVGTIDVATLNVAQFFEPVVGLGATLTFEDTPLNDLPVGDIALLDKLDYDNNYLNLKDNSEINVLSGQLALVTNGTPNHYLTGQEISDKINQAFLDYFDRDRSSVESWYTLYPRMGFSMEGGEGFDFTASYAFPPFGNEGVSEYNNLLPIGLANKTYNYAFYLKEQYTKTDDAVPKFVENTGPAAFIQVGTLSDISSTDNFVGYWSTNDQGTVDPDYQTEIPSSANLIGSVSQRLTRVETDFFDFNDVVGVFARTQNTGTVYYDIGETNWFIPNALSAEDADTIFDPETWGGEDYGYFCRITDENFDRDILSNELSYFNGGVLSFQSLPQGSKFMTMVNGTAYYGSIIDNESRVFQSAPGVPSSAPRLLFSDFEDPITALNSFLEKPIVFTDNKTWRIEGVKDATGVGRVFLRIVSDEFGCISNQSVVKTNVGLFYWSKVGIIYTDGLRALRVSEHLLARFQLWKEALMPNGLEIGPVGLRGAYDEVTKQIIYSGINPDSLVTANEVEIATVVSPAYVFPKGLFSDTAFEVLKDGNDTYLEITVRNDGDAFADEMLAYNDVYGQIIKVIDSNLVSWTFITNLRSVDVGVTLVTVVQETNSYTVRFLLVTGDGVLENDQTWQMAVMKDGVLLSDLTDLLLFGSYDVSDFGHWGVNNPPGSFEITDPQNFEYYSYDFSDATAGTPIFASGVGIGATITFKAADNTAFDDFEAELVTFLATEGDILRIDDGFGETWILTSTGVGTANPTFVSRTTDTIVLTVYLDDTIDIVAATITLNGVAETPANFGSFFEAWLLGDDDDWSKFNGMGIIKTAHLPIELPLANPYGVPNWILLDVYYGVSKSMPFYTADGPALLKENRRFKRDTFQTRVVWFSEDTLNIYRGQTGYERERVIGSAILTHEEGLTNDEVYETIDFPIYSPIDPFYKSVALSHGQKGARKWTSRIMINFVDLNSTGVSIQPLGWNDLNPTPHKLSPCINYQHFKQVDFSPDADPDFPPTIIQYFKNTDTSIYGEHLISYRRRFPRGKIRNVYKQFGFEQLVQDWMTLTAATITKIHDEPFSPVKVRLDTPDKTFILGNGASYAKFSWSDKWFKIVEVTNDNINGGDPSYIEFIALTSRDTLSTSGIVLTEDVLIGRAPLDQALQLSDWTMTFTRLGDRTQGLPKATELGGHT